MIASLGELFQRYNGYAYAGFNVFGYEDAKAVLEGAEECQTPVILMINRDAASYIPLDLIGPLLNRMAQKARVPVAVHLDHAVSLEAIRMACECGFSSVMFDGSQLSMEENIERTLQTIRIARREGISVEAEIGSVGYSDPAVHAKQAYTEPEDAKRFYEATKVDCLAVSVGTVHRMTTQSVTIQYERLHRIQRAVSVPLVIHGASSVANEDLTELSREGIRKINLGTCLRMAFGNTLRYTLAQMPEEFDRIKLFQASIGETRREAIHKIRLLQPSLMTQSGAAVI